MGIKEVVSAKQSPWQNPFVERVIGSIRRECLDHVVALGEDHVRSARVAGAIGALCLTSTIRIEVGFGFWEGQGCASMFGWASSPRSVEFIQGLHRVPEAKLSDAMVRFSSLCENTYFEPGWWDALHSVKKRLLRERQRATIDPDPIAPTLRPDALLLADWGAARRVTNLSAAELEDTGA